MLTCNPCHWPSLGHDCVLYGVDMGSHRDYFPVNIPKMGMAS